MGVWDNLMPAGVMPTVSGLYFGADPAHSPARENETDRHGMPVPVPECRACGGTFVLAAGSEVYAANPDQAPGELPYAGPGGTYSARRLTAPTRFRRARPDEPATHYGLDGAPLTTRDPLASYATIEMVCPKCLRAPHQSTLDRQPAETYPDGGHEFAPDTRAGDWAAAKAAAVVVIHDGGASALAGD